MDREKFKAIIEENGLFEGIKQVILQTGDGLSTCFSNGRRPLCDTCKMALLAVLQIHPFGERLIEEEEDKLDPLTEEEEKFVLNYDWDKHNPDRNDVLFDLFTKYLDTDDPIYEEQYVEYARRVLADVLTLAKNPRFRMAMRS